MRVDCEIFPFASAQQHMEAGLPLDFIHDWCMDNGPAIRASCNQAQKLGITGTGDIRFFMEPFRQEFDSARAEDTDGS